MSLTASTQCRLSLSRLIHLQFEAGKKYALIGQNKAGKSTLTKIICKLYKPDEGYIALNGIPYSEIPRVVLRNLISYIPQKAFIFPGTIRENILVGNPNATEEERKSLT